MKKEILQVDKQRGIVRCTTLDERWYSRERKARKTGLPTIEFRGSITYKAKFYPKGKGFETYLKKNGEDADNILALAGERGTKVHQAIEVLNNGEEVKMTDKFTSNITGQAEALTPDEYWCVMTYARWWEEEGSKEYEIEAAEDIIWPEIAKTPENGDLHSEDGGIFCFAATRDVRLRRIIDGHRVTVDVKTSKDIYPSHIIQVSAIAAAEGDDEQAILQVGYTRNKHGYKFTPVERRLDLLRAATTIWAYETEGDKPLQRDYPLSLSLGLPKKPNDELYEALAQLEELEELEQLDPTGPIETALPDISQDAAMFAFLLTERGPIEKAVSVAEEAGEPELADIIGNKAKKEAAQEDEAVENYEGAA